MFCCFCGERVWMPVDLPTTETGVAVTNAQPTDCNCGAKLFITLSAGAGSAVARVDAIRNKSSVIENCVAYDNRTVNQIPVDQTNDNDPWVLPADWTPPPGTHLIRRSFDKAVGTPVFVVMRESRPTSTNGGESFVSLDSVYAKEAGAKSRADEIGGWVEELDLK